MPILKLTKKNIDALVFTGKPTDYYDTELKGFGLRVGSTSKSFFARKEVDGAPVRYTIGKLGPWTPDQAREEAKEQLRKMGQGVNPSEDKKRAKEARRTLADAWDGYLEKKKLKPTTLQSMADIRKLYLAPMMSRPLDTITRSDVLELHLELTRDRGPASANLAMSYLRIVWNFTHAHLDPPPPSPTMVLTSSRRWNPIKRRRDRLALTQLGDFYAALSKLRDTRRDAFTLILHTGMRAEEAANLLWPNVDLDKATFTVPDTKNGTDLVLPLSSYSVGMLRCRRELDQRSLSVFPGQGKSGKVSLESQTLQGKGFSGLMVHGLRRTFRAICESIGIPHATIKQLMNHSLDGDMTDSYLVLPVEEMRPWVEKISAEIMRLTEMR